MTDESTDLPSDEGQSAQEQSLDEAERAVEQLKRALHQMESFQNDTSQENPQLGELAQRLLDVVAEHRQQSREPLERSPSDWDDEEGA